MAASCPQKKRKTATVVNPNSYQRLGQFPCFLARRPAAPPSQAVSMFENELQPVRAADR
jgi:hypothetical protein